MAPTIPVIAAAPIIQTISNPFLPRVTTLQVPGVSIMPPPVPPPMFMSQGFRPPPGFPMPMPNIFLPHQLRQQPAKQSATIESAPKIYNSEVPTSNATTNQTAAAPVTFVSDELLAKAFRKYPSFQKAKVVRDSRSNKSKGYGFVAFSESDDYVRAMREMDGKYVGNRPIKLRKSNWKDRNYDVVKKKQKQKAKLGLWG
ncbi:RRM domain-containing protein [Trichostrongylus colubriformis]|uniref:RNA-binding protein 42 n=1 Tax=Trichostrongylus colubriformis TaxID=6319 RepID=A0AAN8G6Z7_TRICO